MLVVVSLIMTARHVLMEEAFVRECPRWKAERQVQQVKYISLFYEARKLVETYTPVAASKSYDASVSASIAMQTDLTWANAEDTIKKAYDLELKKSNRTSEAGQYQPGKSTQVLLDSRNLSNDLSGVPSPRKSKTGKGTKKSKASSKENVFKNNNSKQQQTTTTTNNNIIPLDSLFESW